MSAPPAQEQPAQAQPAAAEAPTTTATATSNGPIDNNDLKLWTDRFNEILSRPSEHLNSKSAPGAQSWFAGFFDCFNPIDSCLITCCVPCVTFGKAHHRMNKDPDLKGYEPVNTSCLLSCGAGCLGCFCVPVAMQNQMMREKYNLEGSCVKDLLCSWCCGCCILIQQDKEAEHREHLLRQEGVTQQYKSDAAGMTYPQ